MNKLQKKFGELLQIERERQGIDLDDLSAQLKIDRTNLESIEAGQADQLPSDLYFTLFAKSYAEALGIDYNRTMEAMKAELEDQLSETEQASGATDASPSGSAADSDSSPSAGETREVPKSESSPLVKRLVIAFAVLVVVCIGALLLANQFFGSGGESDASQGGDNVDQSVATGPDSETVSELDSYNWQVTEYEAPSELTLTLTAERDSWTTILADGDTAMFRQLDAGQTATVTAEHRMTVSISVPSAVTVMLNGKTVDLRDPSTRRVSRVYIDQANVADILNPPVTEPAPQSPSETSSPDTAASAGGARAEQQPSPAVPPETDNEGNPTP